MFAMTEGLTPPASQESPSGGDQRLAPNKPPVRRAPIAWEALATLLPPDEGIDLTRLLRFDHPQPAQYVVPRRFGMSAILGIMTALAVLFGGFRLYDAHPVLYLFFGVQVLVICIAQMLYGQTPRFASIASGGALLPVFLIGWMTFWDHRLLGGGLCMLIVSVPLGAFLGYITGTMAAGIFLVMDAAEKFFTGAEPGDTRMETTA
jgi:hypothetical protein